ncbi:branched-chain amino acid ABC transporter permease [Petroclostridium sp. X23]|uniref:branched-chain amino acid ABC transporter permease n=1 Tax=Petroclostridium sp. X23 TaxID=3045146 RepID=UPI0024ACBE7A|nr:branched-chain amino acid ABC transporter permease [Petroclostridium sp. X23]WHH58049.1 branched-chain amino acid ABC transporter permease [Petroclostridium sp. X23]
METALQLIISGIAFGCIYCLVAIEFSLIWNASSLINFGHDKFIMLGAYVFGGTMVNHLGLNFFIAFILASVLMGLFGAAVATGIFNPLRNMPSDLYAVMGTIMLAKIIAEIARLFWGPEPFTLENFLTGTARVGNIALPKASVYIIIISILFLILQHLLFTKTKIGKAMRCVAQDKVASALMGIDVSRNIVITVVFSSIICCIIGIMIIPLFSIEVNMANMIGLKGFAASVVGGFGTIPGAIAGGVFIGLIENIYLMFGPAIYKDVVAFVLFILFLLIRPQGIIGKRST